MRVVQRQDEQTEERHDERVVGAVDEVGEDPDERESEPWGDQRRQKHQATHARRLGRGDPAPKGGGGWGRGRAGERGGGGRGGRGQAAGGGGEGGGRREGGGGGRGGWGGGVRGYAVRVAVTAQLRRGARRLGPQRSPRVPRCSAWNRRDDGRGHPLRRAIVARGASLHDRDVPGRRVRRAHLLPVQRVHHPRVARTARLDEPVLDRAWLPAAARVPGRRRRGALRRTSSIAIRSPPV